MEANGAGNMCDADDSTIPDSTTKDRILFSEGEDVLVRNKDGRFYLGTVVQLDMQSGRCLVKFLDNTEVWSVFHEVSRLSTDYCVVCKSSASQPDNKITPCDKCSCGYHQLCHQPAIPSSVAEGTWQCLKCRKPARKKKKELNRKRSPLHQGPPSPVSTVKEVSRCASTSSSTSSSGTQQLPYDLKSLCWDVPHHTNDKDCYCYCGGPGLWFLQMLQCAQCQQWFHQNCVKCLHYPLYCGDRFYVFICSMCNNGCEFLRRFELTLVDILHLALFNMTVFFAEKYFDLDSEILPYINRNAFSLQLPAQIMNSSLDVMRESILDELVHENNEKRFTCGKEIKKRTTIWGLRVRVPPKPHVFTLPETRPITDAALQEFWSEFPKLKKLKLLPLSSVPLMESGNPPLVHHPDGLFRVFDLSVMMGTSAAAATAAVADHQFWRSLHGLRLLHMDIPGLSAPASPGRRICIKSSENIGHGGYVNKCASHLAPNKLTLQQPLLRQKLKAMRPKRKHFFKRSKSLSLPEDKKGGHRAATERRSYSADTKKEPPPSDQASCDDEDSHDDRNIPAKLPPTPPSSVSAPGTPLPGEPTASPGDTSDSGGADAAPPPPPPLCLSIAKLFGSPMTLPAESSTSTPSEGQAAAGTAGSPAQSASKAISVLEPMSLHLPLPFTKILTQPPQRAVKRKLSEKDIRIDRNGDVKRRRVRRSRSGLRSVQLDSGERLETRLVGGKLLRSPLKTSTMDLGAPAPASVPAQPSVAEAAASRPPTPPPCPPSPPTPQVSMEAIKKSVNSYFGATNRIASGEKYLIKGKRTTPCGRTQYLIEWKS